MISKLVTGVTDIENLRNRKGKTMTIDATNLPTLNGLRVAVTGGTSGLGLALVEELRRGGADVAFVARNQHDVRDVVR